MSNRLHKLIKLANALDDLDMYKSAQHVDAIINKTAKATFDIEAALTEVQDKTEEEIETETAFKWASRAIACFQLHKETKLIKWLLVAEDYRHEAIEHAALVKDDGKIYKQVTKEIDKYRTSITDDETAPVARPHIG